MDLAYVIRVNRFPGLKELCQKKDTHFVIDKFKSFYPSKFNFLPISYRLPEDNEKLQIEMLLQYNKTNPKVFIAKPTKGSQGDGIFIVQDYKDIPQKTYVNKLEYIV